MTKISPAQQKAELRKNWYNIEQLSALTKYYGQDLKGVTNFKPLTSFEQLQAVVEDHDRPENKVSVTSYRIESSPTDAHVFSVMLVKDIKHPGKVLAITQDSEGRPIPKAVAQALKDALVKQCGAGNVVHYDLGVTQQGNNIDCIPITLTNNGDTLAAVLECYKNGESVIDKGADYFRSKLSIQKPENLTSLREEHAKILEGMKKSAQGIRIQKGSLAEKEELEIDETPFEYKRKKPLCQDGFEAFYEKKEEPQKKPTIPEMGGLLMKAFWDTIIIDWLGLEEKKKSEEKKEPEKTPGPSIVKTTKQDETKQEQKKEVPENVKEEAKKWGDKANNPSPPTKGNEKPPTPTPPVKGK